MTVTTIETANQALTALKEFLAKTPSAKSIDLPTDGLYPVLTDVIREIEKICDLPKAPCFLRANYQKNEFFALKVPELAMVDGKPSLIVLGQVHPAKFLTKSKNFKFEQFGKPETKDVQYVVFIESADNEETRAIPVKCWFDTSETAKLLDTVLLKKKPEYLLENLLEYIFPTDTLADGTYSVESFQKNGRFYTVRISGRLYHSKEKHIEQLQTRQAEGKPLTLVIAGMRSATLEDGTVVQYRNTYIDGYAPGTYLKQLVAEYCGLPAEEELKAAKRIVFESPLTLAVKEVTTTTVKIKGEPKIQHAIMCETSDGRTHALLPNNTLKKAIDAGKFNVESFDGFQIHIDSVEHFNGYKFNISYKIPQSAIRMDSVLSGLAATLGLG